MSYSRESLAAFCDVLGSLYTARSPTAAAREVLPKLDAVLRPRPAGVENLPGCPENRRVHQLPRPSEHGDDQAQLTGLLREHIERLLRTESSAAQPSSTDAGAWEMHVGADGTTPDLSPAVAEVLERYFPNREAGALPDAVCGWVRQQITALRRSTPSAESGPPLSVAAPFGRLVLCVRSAVPGHDGFLLQLREQRGAADFLRLRGLGLTRRECEVVFWIAQGKRDAEIATIVGCARRTVGKHVENVLAKLRAETRLAAAHTAQEWLARSE